MQKTAEVPNQLTLSLKKINYKAAEKQPFYLPNFLLIYARHFA